MDSEVGVKVLSRSVREHTGAGAVIKRNSDPRLHPFQRAREYTRALNATKLERVFAKPFIASLDAHSDGVYCIGSIRGTLSTVASGSYNGELIVWDIAKRNLLWKEDAHSGFLRGVVSSTDGARLWTCGDDKVIKIWNLKKQLELSSGSILSYGDTDSMFRQSVGEIVKPKSVMPVTSIMGDYPFVSIDHHWTEDKFATCGLNVDIWDETRTSPIHTFNWGADTILSLKFNPVETSIVATTGSDRAITLYDIRVKSPLKKLLLSMNSNAISWNPMEAYHFSVANEDHNCYTYDMRKLHKAAIVHRDHVSAVMSIDYSPTGKEFVTGSYDRSVRIFPVGVFPAKSREVYHAKRMQRVFCVKFTADNRFVLSGSDDTNIRIWKARSNEKLDVLTPREEAKLEYDERLKEKYEAFPEIKRIGKHRHVPRAIFNARRLKHVIAESKKAKFENQVKHSRPGTVKNISVHKKNIVQVLK